MKKYTNKKILVTGASRGIGKAIALQLGMEGAEVFVHYHEDVKEAEEVKNKIINSGGIAHSGSADLGNVSAVRELADLVWRSMGRVDCLVNNAGVSYKKHFLDATEEDVDHFTSINFKGTLFLTQAITRKMVHEKIEGNIATITSINGLQPGVGLSIYGASKGALETLMKGVALELAPHNIRVNTFAVGAIKTLMTEGTWKEEERHKLVTANIPLGRLGEAEEIAAVICDLMLSGTYMTGATIRLDGGWMLKQGYATPKPYG